MGLDMYLTKKTYIGAEYEHRKVNAVVEITQNGKKIEIDPKKISQIEERAGYWRKANQIHKWFVDNVQNGVDDCGDYEVSVEQLQALLEVCKKVKETAKLVSGVVANGASLKNGEWIPNFEAGKQIENAEAISELLPTASGFFFGSTDYDEWFFKDIEKTIEIIESAVKDNGSPDYDVSFFYHSSW